MREHYFLLKIYNDFTRKELCKSLHSGYDYLALQSMYSKPNIP